MRQNIIKSGLSILPYVVGICVIYATRVDSTESMSEDHVAEHSPSLASVKKVSDALTVSNKGGEYAGYVLFAIALARIGYYLYANHIERRHSREITTASASIGALSIREQYARARKENDELKKTLALFVEQNRNEIFLSLNPDIRYEPTEETPEEFICPITREIMRHPIRLERQCYEYSALKTWYEKGNPISPLTRKPMPDPSILPIDVELRTRIVTYIVNSQASLSNPSNT